MNPFETTDEVQVSPDAARRLRLGHLWVYARDVVKDPKSLDASFVRVLDSSRNVLGHALHSRHSQIRLRLMTRGEQPLTVELLRSRVQRSIGRRPTRLGYRSACRLVFGEADLLPSIVIDRYGDFLVVQTLSRGADLMKPQLIDILIASVNPSGIMERNDVRARRLEGLEGEKGVIWGDVPTHVKVKEEDILLLADLAAGQKTGLFLDQSENRIAARKYASGRGLDCFTNTGAFAFHLARRCESVLAVDVSKEALEQGRRNAACNNFDNVDFQKGNVFDFLREKDRAGEKFDIICLDPPAFAKNRESLKGAKSGYKEINLRAMKLLRHDGVLITSSCSYHLGESAFLDLILQAAHDAHRYVQVLEKRSQSSDHPVLASMPETLYLKCFILRVI